MRLAPFARRSAECCCALMIYLEAWAAWLLRLLCHLAAAAPTAGTSSRLAQKHAAGQPLLGDPARRDEKERSRVFKLWPLGSERQSVDVPPPIENPIDRRWMVQVVFLGVDRQWRHAGFNEWDEGQFIRLAYDTEMRDHEDYDIESIIEVSPERDHDWGTNLDQPILANLTVTAIARGPSRESAQERALLVPEREPESAPTGGTVSRRTAAGDDRGAGESFLEGSASG